MRNEASLEPEQRDVAVNVSESKRRSILARIAYSTLLDASIVIGSGALVYEPAVVCKSDWSSLPAAAKFITVRYRNIDPSELSNFKVTHNLTSEADKAAAVLPQIRIHGEPLVLFYSSYPVSDIQFSKTEDGNLKIEWDVKAHPTLHGQLTPSEQYLPWGDYHGVRETKIVNSSGEIVQERSQSIASPANRLKNLFR